MRQLLDRFIRAEEAENIIPATADFSFLDLITSNSNTDEVAEQAEQEAGSKKAAAEKITAKTRQVINDWNSRDKAQALSFAQRLQDIIDEMQRQTEETTESIKKLIELLKQMKSKQQTPEGIDTPVASALWNNRKDWLPIEDEAQVISFIQRIEEYFSTKVYAGWKDTTKPAGFKCLRGLQKLLGNAINEEQLFELHRIVAANYKD